MAFVAKLLGVHTVMAEEICLFMSINQSSWECLDWGFVLS